MRVQWLWFCYRISNYSIDSYLLVAWLHSVFISFCIAWSKAVSYFCVSVSIFTTHREAQNCCIETWNCYQFGWMFDCITSFDPWNIESTQSQSFTHSCFGHAKLERKIRTIHLVHYRNIIWIVRFFYSCFAFVFFSSFLFFR